MVYSCTCFFEADERGHNDSYALPPTVEVLDMEWEKGMTGTGTTYPASKIIIHKDIMKHNL